MCVFMYMVHVCIHVHGACVYLCVSIFVVCLSSGDPVMYTWCRFMVYVMMVYDVVM